VEIIYYFTHNNVGVRHKDCARSQLAFCHRAHNL